MNQSVEKIDYETLLDRSRDENTNLKQKIKELEETNKTQLNHLKELQHTVHSLFTNLIKKCENNELPLMSKPPVINYNSLPTNNHTGHQIHAQPDLSAFNQLYIDQKSMDKFMILHNFICTNIENGKIYITSYKKDKNIHREDPEDFYKMCHSGKMKEFGIFEEKLTSFWKTLSSDSKVKLERDIEGSIANLYETYISLYKLQFS
jgi:hypothetical protein